MSANQDQILDELVGPLRAHLASLDEQVVQITNERDELLTRRAKVRKTLGFLAPEEAKKTKPKHSHTPEENVIAVQKFIEARNGELEDGFSATSLYNLITLNGEPLVGKDPVRRAVLTLHERGILRLDRKGSGGSRIFKLVSHE